MLQYAVDVLHVKHILVVGHYGCGGVKAVLDNLRVGLVDNWLRHIQDVRQKHLAMLNAIADPGRPPGPPVRAQRHRAGAQRLSCHRGPRCLGTGART